MNGIINVLKPPGMTSHDIIYFVRKKLKMKKVGHTGTLDPEAAGVLPVCVGKATKAVQYITDKKKKYRTTIKFGIQTETYDKYGAIVESVDVESIDMNKLQEVLQDFRGVIKQLPPIYSAIKLAGKKLYQYALEGEAVEIQEREVEVYSIEVVDYNKKDEVVLDIECSKGTYIRSICFDIGKKMGCGAAMWQLVRLASTPFNIENSYTLEEIEKAATELTIDKMLISVDIIFKELPIIEIKTTAHSAAINGGPIYGKGILQDVELFEAETEVRIVCDNEFLGLGIIKYSSEEDRKYIKIDKMFI
ncbi:MAG: tRNA pseudouridine(55) synthase TruB [Clostridiales bacterium GWB2_37_7]|nr:MAG: tRNA pseudouridine(55) synthase TruB [Clostridiales bacterium GWB2_37_7]